MRLILALAFALAASAHADNLPKLSGLGKPAETRPGPNGGSVKYYPQLPWGHVTYAARYDASGKLISYEQILTEKNIAKVVKDKTQMKEVRDLLGPPWQPETYPLSKLTAWTYPMRIAGDPTPKWFVVQMTPDGVVRDTKLMNDPQFDQPWGFRRR
ncbi:MAG TPA: hypothetical protein VF943_06820 [Burkholderiales bacterium]